jgi:hypothetical protein
MKLIIVNVCTNVGKFNEKVYLCTVQGLVVMTNPGRGDSVVLNFLAIDVRNIAIRYKLICLGDEREGKGVCDCASDYNEQSGMGSRRGNVGSVGVRVDCSL